MTRGRKKDLTIPPSRALVQQRDYRARKAQYVSHLEERCRKAEDENDRLKKELDLARAGLPSFSSPFNPETAKASADLLQQLGSTSASLARFQQIICTDSSLQLPPLMPPMAPSSNVHRLRPASFPSPAPSPPFYPKPSSSFQGCSIRLPPIESFVGGPPTSPRSVRESLFSHPSRSPSPSQSVDSSCCNGYMDCPDFDGEGGRREAAIPRNERSSVWTSGRRTTSDEHHDSRGSSSSGR